MNINFFQRRRLHINLWHEKRTESYCLVLEMSLRINNSESLNTKYRKEDAKYGTQNFRNTKYQRRASRCKFNTKWSRLLLHINIFHARPLSRTDNLLLKVQWYIQKLMGFQKYKKNMLDKYFCQQLVQVLTLFKA